MIYCFLYPGSIKKTVVFFSHCRCFVEAAKHSFKIIYILVSLYLSKIVLLLLILKIVFILLFILVVIVNTTFIFIHILCLSLQ